MRPGQFNGGPGGHRTAPRKAHAAEDVLQRTARQKRVMQQITSPCPLATALIDPDIEIASDALSVLKSCSIAPN
eukprot:13154848-Heterocapsa_arctica.AAC.1